MPHLTDKQPRQLITLPYGCVQDPESKFYGHSPLSIAAYKGNSSMVRLLLENKANINFQVD